MCNCNENLENLKESVDLTVKNNKNTNITFNININGTKKKTPVPTPSKVNTISLDEAKKWAENWRNLESDYNKYHKCRAFNIPKIDLQEVLAEDGVESIRAYIGVKESTNSKGEKEYEEKLMIVGVDENGKDMLPSATKGNTLAAESADDSGIFDFTDPCPSACDSDSPLN
ncbi:hypothetical protein [Polaribacter staleyi]|uniref:hypothetical protein n=1 Tax=Polaribacter staleyi TaxID=2022337 RepID=UPI0031B9AF91